MKIEMNKHILPIALLFASLFWVSCSHVYEHAYVKDAPRDEAMEITNNFDATIYPNDQLYIYVNSHTPEAVVRFNEETNKTNTQGTKGVRGGAAIKGYLVSNNGDIMFPVLGKMHVEGMTRDDLRREIEARLIEEGYVLDPVVTVDLMNFHVTVIGEVKVPRMIHSIGSRLTIFEALAQCGDITIDGLRTNVLVIRSTDSTQICDTLDLTKKEALNSPYYYLQQNDIVYVEPTPEKKRKAWRDEDWPKYVNIGVHSLNVAYRTVYTIIRINHYKSNN